MSNKEFWENIVFILSQLKDSEDDDKYLCSKDDLESMHERAINELIVATNNK